MGPFLIVVLLFRPLDVLDVGVSGDVAMLSFSRENSPDDPSNARPLPASDMFLTMFRLLIEGWTYVHTGNGSFEVTPPDTKDAKYRLKITGGFTHRNNSSSSFGVHTKQKVAQRRRSTDLVRLLVCEAVSLTPYKCPTIRRSCYTLYHRHFQLGA